MTRKTKQTILLSLDIAMFELYKRMLEQNGMNFTKRIRLLILEDIEYIKNKMLSEK